MMIPRVPIQTSGADGKTSVKSISSFTPSLNDPIPSSSSPRFRMEGGAESLDSDPSVGLGSHCVILKK